MQAYNVELFDSNFNCLNHYVIDHVDYDFDYLSITQNEIQLHAANAKVGDYIRISNLNDEFNGIVSEIEALDNQIFKIKYKSFMSLFDVPILFDTDYQGGPYPLELVISRLIKETYISNADNYQNIPGLFIQKTSETNGWGFNLKSDVENMHMCVINFYKSIIVRAFEKYGIAINFNIDVQQKRIVLNIGKVSESLKVIESDLPNVFKKNILIKKNEKSVNKLTVYDESNFQNKMTFYLHTDGMYDIYNGLRVLPTVFEIKHAKAEENNTFENAAYQIADEVFSSKENNNLIELWILNDDKLINSKDLIIGQECSIISDGIAYHSILSGKKVGDITKLTFGTIRMDLTKILKRRD